MTTPFFFFFTNLRKIEWMTRATNGLFVTHISVHSKNIWSYIFFFFSSLFSYTYIFSLDHVAYIFLSLSFSLSFIITDVDYSNNKQETRFRVFTFPHTYTHKANIVFQILSSVVNIIRHLCVCRYMMRFCEDT